MKIHEILEKKKEEKKSLEINFVHDKINSKRTEKTTENKALLDKCHVAGKILDLNKKIENFIEVRQNLTKLTHEKIELFALPKQPVFPKELKKTYAQNFSSVVLRKRFLKKLSVKSNMFDKILQKTEILTTKDNDLLTLDSYRKTLNKKRKSSREDKDENEKKNAITNLKSLKKI